MRNKSLRSVAFGVMAIAVAAMPLTACSSLVGSSSFGNNRLDVAEIKDIGDYTADRALSEAQAHFRNNDFGYSAALYKRVVELTPNDQRGYVGLSASYDRLGRFDLSDRVYATLYKLAGGTAQYYNNLGYSYMLRGKLGDALANFRRAKEIAPDSVVVANNLQLLQNTAAAGNA